MMIIDTHVHVYPDYDAGAVLCRCADRLHAMEPEAVPLVCLTEREGCHFFKDLCQARTVPGADGFPLEVLENGASLVIRFGRGVPPLFVIPGRQIATRERLEVHCLGKDAAIPDGEPVVQTVGRVLEVDGIAVLPWGVGKWLFRRRAIVDALLAQFPPEQLCLGDSAMRPVFWPTPLPMRRASRAGRRIFTGSDPLPHEKEGPWIGRYAILVDSPFVPQHPAQSCLAALRKAKYTQRGSRPGPVAFARRMAGV
jgi:hypothetical protein